MPGWFDNDAKPSKDGTLDLLVAQAERLESFRIAIGCPAGAEPLSWAVKALLQPRSSTIPEGATEAIAIALKDELERQISRGLKIKGRVENLALARAALSVLQAREGGE